MIRLLKRFFDDINRMANCASFPRSLDVVVTLCQEDRDLLTNYRRYAPRAKKETVRVTEGLGVDGITEVL